ncbi:hypothetical protein [Corynebacterium sp. ACRQJ]|uniref:hypothetical protein n=1 Tax=Corynebacterium sp. ACRQJ TaxID=2918189 RepID=UPI001EF6F42B|nr:hypothetical protein [Corynebacterium sp. ACRQJ]MCG7267549.1 hypothetical protein [Corynebacterium sp. ACRQJ]
MNNPNPYGAMGGNPQFGYGYRPQPNPSYGSRPGTWMLLVSGGATALALLMFTASFLGWTELRFNHDEGIMRLNVNGWGRVVVTGAPEGADVVDSKFSSAGVGVPANVAALSLLIVGAVMLWQAVKPRVASSMFIGAGLVGLGWAIWSIMKIQRALKAMEREEGARLREEGLVFEEVFQGSAEIGVYFAIAISLAIVALGLFALIKSNHQAKVTWGQPSQQGQWGWPGPAI